MKVILGLDISSSCCGYAFLDVDKCIILEYGNIKVLKKDKYSIVERLDNLSKKIEELCTKWQPEYVVIEEISKFMAHRSSANTMITLGIFNRVCALKTYQITNKIPIFYAPISIRSKIKKFMKLDDKIHKEDMPNIIKQFFGSDKFNIKMKKNNKTIDTSTYDEADAVAVAFAHYIELQMVLNK